MEPKEPFNEAPQYKRWRKSLHAQQWHIAHEELLAQVLKPNGKQLFALLSTDSRNEAGQPLPGVVLLRGHFVSVLTELVAHETGKAYLLLVRQRRIANGAWFYEHPAGMCDDVADPLPIALKELEEETGLTAQAQELTRLNQELIYSSPGVLDEGGYFFSLRRVLPLAEIQALEARETGAAGEHEHINLKLATWAEALGLIKNGMGLLHMFLHQQHQQHQQHQRQ